MPAGAIQDKDDKSVRAGSDRAGEGRQDRAEHRRVRRVGQEPHHLPGGRADEAMDIEPSEAMVSDRPRTLAPACPDPADDRLEPGAMLVERPDLHRAVRVGARQLSCTRARKPALNASWAAKSPSACRGRGT